MIDLVFDIQNEESNIFHASYQSMILSQHKIKEF